MNGSVVGAQAESDGCKEVLDYIPLCGGHLVSMLSSEGIRLLHLILREQSY